MLLRSTLILAATAVLASDPATDLVRARAILTTTASSVDLTVDGAALANALFTVGGGDPSIRTRIDGNTMKVSDNTAGNAIDVQIDMILANVQPRQKVAWNLSRGSSGTVRLEVQNLNRAASAVVDRFETQDPSARFTSSSDLLRGGGPLGPVPPVQPHLVLAFFYPWYDLTTWSSPELLDHPQQPYSTDNPTDLTRIMREAKDAGLDALVTSWQGKDFAGGWNHQRMLGSLDAARQVGIKIATLLETTVANPEHEQNGVAPDPATVLEWLEDIVDLYASHPAYLRVDRRPVVFAYGAQRMTEDLWNDVLGRLQARGRDVLLIGEGTNGTRLGAFNGLFFYGTSALNADAIGAFDRAQSVTARTYHFLPGVAGGRRLWVATVSPGYDDTRLADGRVARVENRDDGRYYDAQWQSAIAMQADWIVVTSWNEWWENTEIEPSRRFGDFYLRRTASWASLFRLLHGERPN